MTDTTDLIARLRDNAQGISLGAEGMGWGFDEAMLNEAADALEQHAAQDAINRSNIDRLAGIVNQQADEIEQQAAQIEALQLTKAGLIGSLREEMDEGLRLRELGGALPDENITTMTERLIGERAALSAELSALRAEVERMRASAEKVILFNRDHANDQYGDPNKAEAWACVRELRAALRQEQPT